jgi:alpha-L-rhamnosidase
MLDRIWELCRYSIKATTFAGVYVDGDRERIAYEADAYLNQLSHYACDPDGQMARATFDRLLAYPTWPTEWAFHLIFMAHADWMQTGDQAWLSARYDHLVPKLLLERAREDGLLVSTAAQIEKGDLVDWPGAERDGYVFTPVNTVVNAFHLRALALMAELAAAVGRDGDAQAYVARYERVAETFQRTLFDPARHLYRDGEGTDHTSQHANLFPLAFGLVPSEHRAEMMDWLINRGMRGSVYAAHYLLTALFVQGRDEAALAFMCAPGDRSWRHMVESGTTITWEAWDQNYKPNQDWNHAWGAAPAHLLPRYVLGVQPAAPGGKRLLIRPHPGSLRQAAGRVPTPRGPVEVRWERAADFRLHLALPAGVLARLELPAASESIGVWMAGHPVEALRHAGRWIIPAVTGSVALVVR